jgi:hypothetical protein
MVRFHLEARLVMAHYLLLSKSMVEYRDAVLAAYSTIFVRGWASLPTVNQYAFQDDLPVGIKRAFADTAIACNFHYAGTDLLLFMGVRDEIGFIRSTCYLDNEDMRRFLRESLNTNLDKV